MSERKIVYKMEDGMNPEDVLCTTYQMRDMFVQLGTGYFTQLDTMNYIQHHAALADIRSGDRVLDVCCGRALLLPLLRWHKSQLGHYIGVDIEPKNFRPAYNNSGTTKIGTRRFALNSPGHEDPFYPFPISFIESNVAEMSLALGKEGIKTVDYIVYTASIEHMQRDAGFQSLVECHQLLKPGGRMFISTPNTEGDPYDTQYAAHLYEWSLPELRTALVEVGFTIEQEFGLTAKVRGYEDKLEEYNPEYLKIFQEFKKYLPREWLYSIMPILTPEIADEVALKVVKNASV